MPINPYQSPASEKHDEPDLVRPRWRPGLIVTAIAWTAFFVLALPAFGKARHDPRPLTIPIWFCVTTTCVTLGVLLGLVRAVSGWRHVLIAPLWLILVFLQCVAWLTGRCGPG